jgi:hypothetical protein
MNGYPDRVVLEGVPRVHFYDGGKRCPEDIILPSVMRAVLEYLGEADYGCKHCLAQNPECKVLCTYSFLVGVSGAASYLSWKEGWHGGNPDISYMSDDAGAPERYIFRAIGYAFEWVVKEEGAITRPSFGSGLQRASSGACRYWAMASSVRRRHRSSPAMTRAATC